MLANEQVILIWIVVGFTPHFVKKQWNKYPLWGVKNENERTQDDRCVRNVSDVSKGQGLSIRRLRC